MKIGMGYDVHRLVKDRPLIIGGVTIPHSHGLLGHSDADVLTHAIIDAILGALGQGDIGKAFPDTDAAYKNISSMVLLERVYGLMVDASYSVGNIDATIVAQAPKMRPHIDEMVKCVAKVLQCSTKSVNIKATTTETLGFEGRGEGISSQAVVLLVPRTDGE